MLADVLDDAQTEHNSIHNDGKTVAVDDWQAARKTAHPDNFTDDGDDDDCSPNNNKTDT